jgi:hypothetical protein
MHGNPLRLWFAARANAELSALRRIALAGTRLAKATCRSIRLKLLNIGTCVSVGSHRIKIALASAFSAADVFALAHAHYAEPSPEQPAPTALRSTTGIIAEINQTAQALRLSETRI